MQRTLHNHIMRLEDRIQRLSDELTDPRCEPKKRDRVAAEIQKAELAVSYYRKAYALENEIAGQPTAG
jgi:hypothetical protein